LLDIRRGIGVVVGKILMADDFRAAMSSGFEKRRWVSNPGKNKTLASF
jgi:hypothetical protein